MRSPRNVEVWEHAPDRKLAQFKVHLKNVKGALAQVSKVVSDVGANILTGHINAPGSSASATFSFFADITEVEDGAVEIKKRLLSLKTVESAEVIVAEDGFMVDKLHFPVQWSGRRALILRADALSEMLGRLWMVFGSGAAAIIDQMAEAMGEQSAKEIIEDFGAKFAMDQLDELLGTYTALGYADVSVERTKAAEFPMVIHAKDLFECTGAAKRNIRQKSNFFRAHLRGFMSGLFDSEFEVQEVQCVTSGDEVCSFHVALAESAYARVAVTRPERSHLNRR